MKLLVATDGSKYAMRAVRFAAKLAADSKSPGRITLISVHDDVALNHARQIVGRQAVDNYLRDLSEKDLSAARKILDKAGVRHDMIIRTGHVAAEIAATADKGGFDLIVVGSKGRSALGDLLIGSIARRVTELANTPVLLVKK